MLAAMEQAMPKALHDKRATAAKKKTPDWRQLRRQEFTQRYQKVLGVLHACVDCGEPIAESMLMISIGNSRARMSARSVLPQAVGPVSAMQPGSNRSESMNVSLNGPAERAGRARPE